MTKDLFMCAFKLTLMSTLSEKYDVKVWATKLVDFLFNKHCGHNNNNLQHVAELMYERHSQI